MNQFRVFLRMERKATMAWALGTGAFVGLMGIVYVAMGGSEGLSELAQAYPQEILEAIGADDLTSVLGFLRAEFGSLGPLVFSIFLVTLMTKHLAGAEEGGRLDHTLARPLRRSTYYWSLLAAGACIYAAILLVAALAGVAGFAAEASARELAGIVGLMADMLPFGLTFLSLGALLGALFHRRSQANVAGAGIAAALFALDFVARLASNAQWAGYLTPFGYLGRSDLANGHPDLGYLAFALSSSILLAFAGWFFFDRKDLYA